MKTVGFVGRGVHFDVLVRLLESTGTGVLLWQPEEFQIPGEAGKLPAHVKPVALERLADTPLIFYSIPITFGRDIARRLGDVITGRQVIVHTSRSLEPHTLKTLSTMLQEETPTHRCGFLTGPMRVEDIQAGLPASGVCASLFPEVHDMLEECLMSERFRVYRTDDLAGAEVSAAYSRVLAMVAGLCYGRELGTSLQATLFARGLAEMARFVTFREGFERTAFGLAGAGNLYADTHLGGSSSFRIGVAVAEAGRVEHERIREQFGPAGHDLLLTLEGLASGARAAGLPQHILAAANAVAAHQMRPEDAVMKLMTLPALYE